MQPLDVAREAAETAGKIITDYFRQGVVIRGKESYNLVSDADLDAERAIVRVIRQSFPDHAVLGEEMHQADLESEHLWVVDPLDGTNNFAHQIPHFAVSIAYYHRGQPVCGVIYNPLRQDWHIAARGQGATWNGQPVKVGAQQRLDQILVGVGFFYDRGLMMEATLTAIGELFRRQIHGIRRFGTASLDLCHVAMGMFGAYFEYQLAPWDFAAGRLFVEEAGGTVTTCLGQPLVLGTSSLLASNGQVHQAMLEVVQTHAPR